MKKLVSLLTAVLMAAASIPALALASAPPEEAIAAAKTIFDIPEDLTEFRYDVDDEGYDLQWMSKDYEKSVSVQLNKDLVPVNYYSAVSDYYRGIAKLRRDELQSSAESFIKQTIPSLADKLVLSEEGGYSSSHFIFNRCENGVPVEENFAQVDVSKNTGEVTGYSLNWDFDSDFSGESAVSEEQAMQKLSDKAVKTEYRIFGDKALPVYVLEPSTYISAADGEAFSARIYYSGNAKNMSVTMDAESSATSDGGMGGGYRLTEEEVKEVEKMASLVSADKVNEIIASLPELMLPENYELKLRYTSRKSKDEAVYRIIGEFDTDENYGRITLDGETGEVLGFYSYGEDSYTAPENPLSDEACHGTADGFLAKVTSLEDYTLKEEDESVRYDRSSRSRRYIRSVNGIPYPSDYKYVEVSRKNGKIQHYSVGAPTAEIVVPASMTDKTEAVKNNFTAELVYAYQENGGEVKPVLAYKLSPDFGFYCLRAEDGAAVDYEGEIAVPDEEKNDETDHWAWEIFDILRENRIYISGNYSLDEQITKKDFISLLEKLTMIDAVPYRYRPESENDDETMLLPVTREEAAKLTAEQMGWDKLIGLDIYTTKFSDEADFEGGIGAAAILQGLGVLKGNTDGSYVPKENLTYGQAYSIVYNLAFVGSEG